MAGMSNSSDADLHHRGRCCSRMFVISLWILRSSPLYFCPVDPEELVQCPVSKNGQQIASIQSSACSVSVLIVLPSRSTQSVPASLLICPLISLHSSTSRCGYDSLLSIVLLSVG